MLAIASQLAATQAPAWLPYVHLGIGVIGLVSLCFSAWAVVSTHRANAPWECPVFAVKSEPQASVTGDGRDPSAVCVTVRATLRNIGKHSADNVAVGLWGAFQKRGRSMRRIVHETLTNPLVPRGEWHAQMYGRCRTPGVHTVDLAQRDGLFLCLRIVCRDAMTGKTQESRHFYYTWKYPNSTLQPASLAQVQSFSPHLRAAGAYLTIKRPTLMQHLPTRLREELSKVSRRLRPPKF